MVWNVGKFLLITSYLASLHKAVETIFNSHGRGPWEPQVLRHIMLYVVGSKSFRGLTNFLRWQK